MFSTKGRSPQISEPEELWTYLRGIARNRGVDTLAVGGTANHVHMLISLASSLTIANLMRDLKANSSRHLNEKERGFAWQDGYAAISVSPSQIDVVRKYIENQEQHHTTRNFESEYSRSWINRACSLPPNTSLVSVAALRLGSPSHASGGLRPRLTSSRRCAADLIEFRALCATTSYKMGFPAACSEGYGRRAILLTAAR